MPYSMLYALLYAQKKKDVGLSLEYAAMANALILVEQACLCRIRTVGLLVWITQQAYKTGNPYH